jgi:hypothetical protein
VAGGEQDDKEERNEGQKAVAEVFHGGRYLI